MKRMARSVVLVFTVTIFLLLGIYANTGNAAEKVIKWRAQSAWPKGPGHQEIAEYFARTINELSGGRLIIEKMYADGEIVGGFEAIPAAAKGKLDMVHSSGFYLTGTLPWISLIIGTQANFITYPDEHIAWMYDGGGLEIYQKYLDTKYNLKVIPTSIHASEPLWSTKPITAKKDFKGLKIRSTGLNMTFYQNLGAAVSTMPMGEVVPALERRTLDAVEFCVPYTDYAAGLHKVCPYALVGRIHLPCMLGLEAFINANSWQALPDDLKRVVENAAKLTVFKSIHYWNGTQAVFFSEKMIQEGVKINVASPELQAWFNEVGDNMADEFAKKDPWAKQILESQKAFVTKYKKYQGVMAPYFRD